MSEGYKYSAKSRIPTRPLSYENRALAVPKELILDYSNLNIYICDISGNIVNITEKMMQATANLIDETLSSNETKDEIRNISIKLDSGETVTINSAIVYTYNELNRLRTVIQDSNNSLEEKIKETMDAIPSPSNADPKKPGSNANSGTSIDYSRADHIHPKGESTVADSAKSVEWSGVKNAPSFSSSDHNHDTKYLMRKDNEVLTGNLISKNNKGLIGYATDNSERWMLYMDQNNRVHIGYNNTSPIYIDGKLAVRNANYGVDEPKTDGAITGQVYFQLI